MERERVEGKKERKRGDRKRGPQCPAAPFMPVVTNMNQANSSLMSLPPLAIFIGRPFFAVKVVCNEMPSAWQTEKQNIVGLVDEVTATQLGQ